MPFNDVCNAVRDALADDFGEYLGDCLLNFVSDSSLDIVVGVLDFVSAGTGVVETEEVSAADVVAFAVNIVVVHGIPVSISLFTAFIEAVTLGFALLLNIV